MKKEENYDFAALAKINPDFAPYIQRIGEDWVTIDFTNRDALKQLTKSILMDKYHITYWDVPEDYLIPAFTMRLNYVKWVADLLDSKRLQHAKVIDIGVGASCIFPLIGVGEYKWRFLGTDVDDLALENAKEIVKQNKLEKFVELRKQENFKKVIEGVVMKGEKYDLLMCNPPFYHTTEERKVPSVHKLNPAEETTEGGEVGFIQRLLQESQKFKEEIRWYSILIGKKIDFEFVKRYIKHFVEDVKQTKTGTIDQGKNRRWVIAWSYFE